MKDEKAELELARTAAQVAATEERWEKWAKAWEVTLEAEAAKWPASGAASTDQFLREVNEAFARLRSNEKAWAEYENEVAEWDHVADPLTE